MAQALRMAVREVICETAFYGIYTVLFLISSYILLFKKPASKATFTLLAATAIMYGVSTAHWAVTLVILLPSIGNDTKLSVPTRTQFLITSYFPYFSYVLSDAIVVWRTWLICDCNTKLFVLPLVCLAAMTIVTIVGLSFGIHSTVAGASSADGQAAIYLAVASWGLTILSNIWLLFLTAWRTWKYRQCIRSKLTRGSTKTNAEKILVLLVESGALYLCLWARLKPHTYYSPQQLKNAY
ncbi:hypothetical protein DENSPDRAFT_879063 [Dentipellis sp. KUC8613]|nr:hypothetical protein DENSPDRAFT_879063 [Dentipellis sp. KUC8613]